MELLSQLPCIASEASYSITKRWKQYNSSLLDWYKFVSDCILYILLLKKNLTIGKAKHI